MGCFDMTLAKVVSRYRLLRVPICWATKAYQMVQANRPVSEAGRTYWSNRYFIYNLALLYFTHDPGEKRLSGVTNRTNQARRNGQPKPGPLTLAQTDQFVA